MKKILSGLALLIGLTAPAALPPPLQPQQLTTNAGVALTNASRNIIAPFVTANNNGVGTNTLNVGGPFTNAVSTNRVFVIGGGSPEVNGEYVFKGLGPDGSQSGPTDRFWTNVNGITKMILSPNGLPTRWTFWNPAETVLYYVNDDGIIGGTLDPDNGDGGTGVLPVPSLWGYGTWPPALVLTGRPAQGDGSGFTNLNGASFQSGTVGNLITSNSSDFASAAQFAPWSNKLDVVLNPPRIGKDSGAVWRGSIPSGAGFNPPGYRAMLYFGAGVSGYVSSIKMTPDTAHTTTSNLCHELRVYVDAGNIVNSNSPPIGNLAFRAPIAMLCNSLYQSPNPQSKGTRYLDTIVKGDAYSIFELKLPMPFTNGILVEDYWEGTNVFGGNKMVRYQLGTLPYPLNIMRCRSSSLKVTNTFLGGNADNGVSRLFLSVTNTPGFLVGEIFAHQGTTNGVNWPEGNWFFQNDVYPTDQLTGGQGLTPDFGGEDLFKNSYYFSAGVNTHYDFGTSYFASTLVEGPISYTIRVEAYRWWEDGQRMTWTNQFYGYKTIINGTTNAVEDYLTIYYSK